MEYTAKEFPNIADIQIFRGHDWVATAREYEFPGTAETLIAALNRHDELRKWLADYQLAIGKLSVILGITVASSDGTIADVLQAAQIMMDDRYRLNDEIKFINSRIEEKSKDGA